MRRLGEKVFIGVDSGGTYTVAIAVDGKGRILGKCIGGQTNFYNSDIDITRENLKVTVDKLMSKCKISEYECLSIGMASLDDEPSRETVSFIIDGIFPYEKVEMQSDVYMALMGMTLGDPGIMIVSGTGAMAVAIDETKKMHVLGGWGSLLQDEGSAYCIAIEGIKAGVKSFEGLGEKTVLEDQVIEFFGVSEHRQLIDKFYNTSITNSEIAAFGKDVIDCAIQGDNVAGSIINRTADILAQYACKLMTKLKATDYPIGIYGGVFQNTPYMVDAFTQRVNAIYPDARIGFPEFSPEIGAVLFAMKKRGYMLTEEVLMNIKKTMGD